VKENIKEDIKTVEYNMKCIRNVMNNFEDELCENMQTKTDEVSKIIDNILSDYKRVLKENEELKNRWDKDTHILQNDLDIANAKNIEKDKIIDLMSEQLITPIHDKKWIKKYYENKVNGGNERWKI